MIEIKKNVPTIMILDICIYLHQVNLNWKHSTTKLTCCLILFSLLSLMIYKSCDASYKDQFLWINSYDDKKAEGAYFIYSSWKYIHHVALFYEKHQFEKTRTLSKCEFVSTQMPGFKASYRFAYPIATRKNAYTSESSWWSHVPWKCQDGLWGSTLKQCFCKRTVIYSRVADTLLLI